MTINDSSFYVLPGAGILALVAMWRAKAEPLSTEERIQELTLKVRHPWKHRAAKLTGWMR